MSVRDVVGGDELGRLRRGRRGEHVQAAVVAHRVGAQELRLAQRGLVADDVGEGLLGVEVEMRRDAAELQVEVDEDDPVRPALRGRDRDVGRDGRRPDAALGAEDGDRRGGRARG